MARYRTKPQETKYAEALKHGDTYFVQRCSRDGKASGEITQVPAAEFEREWEPLKRKPRTESSTTGEVVNAPAHQPAASRR